MTIASVTSAPPDPVVPSTSERAYYSITQAATLLGVSRVSVWRWIRDGRLPVARLGHRTTRIKREALERLLLDSETGGSRAGGFRKLGGQALAELGADDVASRSGWREIGQAEHVAQFYETDAFLLEGVRNYLGAGLRAGETALIVGTKAHREGLEEWFRADGLDVAAAHAGGRYIPLDAAETLARFMVEGAPEPALFAEVIGSVIASAAAAGRPVRVFGEMVALLAAAGDPGAAIRLEGLWNDLQKEHVFSLLCGYPMDSLGEEVFAALVGDVCSEHSRVIPAESYTVLEDPDERLRAIAMLQQKARSLEVKIAERKRSEEQLRRSQRALQEFMENATEGLHWVGPDGRIIWANQAELELLGYAAEEYIGHHLAEFHADPEVIEDILRRLSSGQALYGYEARLLARDGTLRHVLINSSAYWEEGRFVHTCCFTRDITERVRAEELRARLAAIIESSRDAIISKTLDGTITSWNAGAQQLYGYTPEEIVGRPISILVPPDRPDEIPTILDRLRRGERIEHFETVRRSKDGRRLDVSLSISPVREATGRIAGAATIARDITDRKRAEQERELLLAGEQEARRETEAALRLRDEFLSIAAHELRTPLATLSAHAQLALRRLNRAERLEPEQVAEALQKIIGQSVKLSRLLGQLLDVARLEAGKLAPDMQPTDLTALVEQALANARARSEEHVISAHLAAPLEAQVDSLRLEQVLTNLLDNALKYSPDGGLVEVTLSRPSPTTVELSVRDHGLGIPPEKREHIFERFYQGHADGKHGMGIGLYVSRQIVELHGGEIRAEFPPDGGTRFVVRLPLQPDSA